MAGTYKGTLEALLATVIDGEQGALNVNVVAQGAQPTPMGAYKGTPEALLATVVDGEMGAINVNVIAGGAGVPVVVLSSTWHPTDRTKDETGDFFTLPADCLVIGMYWRRDIPSDAGSTPTLDITDGVGLLSGSPFNLASDDTSFFAATHATTSVLSNLAATSGIWPGGISLYTPDPVSFAYVAGLTPGTTTPEFTLSAVCVPIT